MARSLPMGGRLLSTGLALAVAGTLSLTGCSSSTKEAAQQSGEAVGQATKDAAGAVGNAAKEGAGAVGDAAKEGAGAVGDAAKTAAKATNTAALAPAVTPILDLLKKSEGQVKAGNIAAAVASMGGFKALWATAAPVIQPLAGDKWPVINTAANLVLNTFAPGSTPAADKAGSAISGLMGPLSALLAK